MSLLTVVYRLLSHPLTIILGVILGFVVGFTQKEFAHAVEPFGNIYISLLSMCLLPILVTALIWGVGQMLRNLDTRAIFGRMATVYGVGLLIPCIVGVGVAFLLQPGAGLSQESANVIGSRLQEFDDVKASGGLLAFLMDIIPANVFHALSTGAFINIVIFSVLAGLALGTVDSRGADETLRVVNTFYGMFSKLFHWILVPLPIGLFCIVASHIAEADEEMLFSLIGFLAAFWIAGLLVLVVLMLAMAAAARVAPWRPLIALKTPLILAFATDNPFVALYSAIESLQKDFSTPREVADTIVPFGVLANQHGQILLFAVTAMFLVQLYDVTLDPVALSVLALGVILSGAAAVGGGAVLAPVIAPVLLGAGIPDTLAIVILATTQPLVANLSSTLTVQATCTLAVIAAKPLTDAEPATPTPPAKAVG